MNPTYIARLLSYLFLPLFAPTVILAFVLFTDPVLVLKLPLLYRISFVGMVFAITALLPIATIITAYKTGRISNPEMILTKDRIIPQLLTVSIYIGFSLMLSNKMQPGPSISTAMWAATITVAVISFITPFFKISAHSAGAAGTAGLVLGYAFFTGTAAVRELFVFSALLTGAVMWARLYLNVHTPAQAWAGCMLGLLTGFATAAWVY